MSSKMRKHQIGIHWEGPLTVKDVIRNKNHAGTKRDNWAGKDYGIYQIYGRHILYGRNALLYIGQAAFQTFSQRFKQHTIWLKDEWKGINVYLGRLEAEKYTDRNDWYAWRWDVDIAEAILVYKYTPCYNSALKGDYPKFSPFKAVRLLHSGNKEKLNKIDKAPEDYSGNINLSLSLEDCGIK